MKEIDQKFAKTDMTLGLILRIGLEVIFGLRGFLIVPLIARRLGPAEYGVYSQIWTTVTVLVPMISLALDNGIIRNMARASSRRFNIPGVVWSGLIAGAITSISCALVVPFAFPGMVSRLVFGSSEFRIEIRLIGLLTVPATLLTIGQALFQARREYFKISALQAARAVVSLAVMALIAYRGFGVKPIVLAAGIVEVFMLAVMMRMIYARVGKVTWNRAEILSMAAFSWPLAVANVLYVLLNSIPRFSLVHGPGLERVGIYSVAYAITSLLGQVASPVHYVVYPECVRLAGIGDAFSSSRLLDASVKAYLAFAGIVIAVMTIAGRAIVALLTNKNFGADSVLFLALGLGTAFWGVFRLISVQLLVWDRTRSILYALAFGCFVCQIVCLWLVGRAYETGAGFGFLAGNAIALACLLLMLRSGDRSSVAHSLGGWLLKVGAAATASGFLASLWSHDGLVGVAIGAAVAVASYTAILATLGYSQVRTMAQTIRVLMRDRRPSTAA